MIEDSSGASDALVTRWRCCRGRNGCHFVGGTERCHFVRRKEKYFFVNTYATYMSGNNWRERSWQLCWVLLRQVGVQFPTACKVYDHFKITLLSGGQQLADRQCTDQRTGRQHGIGQQESLPVGDWGWITGHHRKQQPRGQLGSCTRNWPTGRLLQGTCQLTNGWSNRHFGS